MFTWNIRWLISWRERAKDWLLVTTIWSELPFHAFSFRVYFSCIVLLHVSPSPLDQKEFLMHHRLPEDCDSCLPALLTFGQGFGMRIEQELFVLRTWCPHPPLLHFDFDIHLRHHCPPQHHRLLLPLLLFQIPNWWPKKFYETRLNFSKSWRLRLQVWGSRLCYRTRVKTVFSLTSIPQSLVSSSLSPLLHHVVCCLPFQRQQLQFSMHEWRQRNRSRSHCKHDSHIHTLAICPSCS